jgi:predicted transposase/invertase (TIGR01784 family)
MAKVTEKQLVRFDWFMKKMLRKKSNFRILEGFLSELLQQEVTIISILESESNQENKKEKFNRVDMLVKTDKSEHIIIEIQNEIQYDFLQRMAFGGSKTMIEHLELGQKYVNIRRVICISIVYFELGKGNDYIYTGNTEFKSYHFKGEVLELSSQQKQAFKYEKVSDIFPTYYLIRPEQYKDRSLRFFCKRDKTCRKRLGSRKYGRQTEKRL